jgi:hypothetical protein
MANKVFVLNNLFDSVNSFRWLHDDIYQRRSALFASRAFCGA